MSASDIAEPKVFALMDRLRQEYARRRSEYLYPLLHEFDRRRAGSSHHLLDFVRLDDAEFVTAAHRVTLGRDPDPRELDEYVESLKAGELTKPALLRRLRLSDQGRRVAVSMWGLAGVSESESQPLALTPLPESSGNFGEKNAYALDDFRVFHDEEFVRNAYRGLLRRAPDRDGLDHFLSLLRRGVLSKVELLGRIRYSAEGRAARVSVSGLFVPFALRTLHRVPLLGRLAAIAQYIVRLPNLVRTIERIESDMIRGQFATWRNINAGYEQLHGHLASMQRQIADSAYALETAACRIAERDSRTDDLLAVTDRALEQLQSKAQSMREALHATRHDLALLTNHVRSRDEAVTHLNNEIVRARRAILDQERTLARAYEAMHSTAEGTNMRSVSDAEDHVLDSFYAAFEDRFRGPEEEIRARCAVYLPIVKEAGAGTRERPVVDIGSGRGEWLSLLRDNGLSAIGIDVNDASVRRCQEAGLQAVAGDGIAYLQACADGSIGAVTSMHVIEHLPFRRFIALLDETLRVLAPGGVAIFETPNPENVMVGACTFYYDPTHERPMPPQPVRAIAELRGFDRVEILPLHPFDTQLDTSVGDTVVRNVINEALYGPRDYAIIATKAPVSTDVQRSGS